MANCRPGCGKDSGQETLVVLIFILRTHRLEIITFSFKLKHTIGLACTFSTQMYPFNESDVGLTK